MFNFSDASFKEFSSSEVTAPSGSMPFNHPSNNNDLSLSKDNAEVVDEKDFTSDERTSTQRNVTPSSNEIVDVITVLDYGQSNNQIHIAIR
ncbi:unnamed protein product [Rotaria sordida]|uniref:Uncharacterized protein n=1 Tax=Rotaria sordida TaxID=392033 RepID=A0A819DVE2_9BILA|nr:unnamed protein product [Rotaria sordida]